MQAQIKKYVNSWQKLKTVGRWKNVNKYFGNILVNIKE